MTKTSARQFVNWMTFNLLIAIAAWLVVFGISAAFAETFYDRNGNKVGSSYRLNGSTTNFLDRNGNKVGSTYRLNDSTTNVLDRSGNKIGSRSR